MVNECEIICGDEFVKNNGRSEPLGEQVPSKSMCSETLDLVRLIAAGWERMVVPGEFANFGLSPRSIPLLAA
jgi:hypothetical protein